MFYNNDLYFMDEDYSPVPSELWRTASPEEHMIIFRWAKLAAREKTKNAWAITLAAYISLMLFFFPVLLSVYNLKTASNCSFILLAIVLFIGFAVRKYNISKVKMIARERYNVADVFLKEKELVRGRNGVIYYLNVAVRYDPDKKRHIRVMKNVYERASTSTRLLIVNPLYDDFFNSYDIVAL